MNVPTDALKIHANTPVRRDHSADHQRIVGDGDVNRLIVQSGMRLSTLFSRDRKVTCSQILADGIFDQLQSLTSLPFTHTIHAVLRQRVVLTPSASDSNICKSSR